MKIKKFTFNPFSENTYVLYDETKECIIIDPGNYFEPEHQELKSFIVENGLKPVRLINTHCHIDHILGIDFVKKTWSLDLEASELDDYNLDWSVQRSIDFNLPVDRPTRERNIVEHDEIKFGKTVLNTIHTPGHSAGSMSFYNKMTGDLISGDVLFRMSVGRHDLLKGDYQTLMQTIINKLYILPKDTKVYSGHGEETTIGYEMKNNPFVTEYIFDNKI
jgi:hydroxyacylglutathione hydrolase